jgi:ribosomal protein S18 acetylase RimI-like enzyme
MGIGNGQIRRIHEDDLAELVILCADHAAYEGSEFHESGQQCRLREALFGPRPVLYGWVVEAEPGLAGFMTATIDYATWPAEFFLHMDCLYLREPFRGRALGRQLIEQLQEFARKEKITLIQWQTPSHNERGIRFYERIGAQSKDKKRYLLDVPS